MAALSDLSAVNFPLLGRSWGAGIGGILCIPVCVRVLMRVWMHDVHAYGACACAHGVSKAVCTRSWGAPGKILDGLQSILAGLGPGYRAKMCQRTCKNVLHVEKRPLTKKIHAKDIHKAIEWLV